MMSTKKTALTGMFACLAFVLSTFVCFPSMAPFQHFVNVIAAVILGPWYAFAAAWICGILRMMGGRTIQAIAGAIFGPVLGGMFYRKTHSIWAAVLGEVVGTGIIGAVASYPLMTMFYGLTGVKWYYYIPFYLPSAIVGALMGAIVILMLAKTGMLKRLQEEINR